MIVLENSFYVPLCDQCVILKLNMEPSEYFFLDTVIHHKLEICENIAVSPKDSL